jgi:hypothetical protein
MFLQRLMAALGVGARTSREKPLFVYIKIPGHIEPLERGHRFEDPIQVALDAGELGEITGGGSQLSDVDAEGRRRIEFCGIDVDLYEVERGLALLRRELIRLDAPRGTVLEYRLEGRDYPQPVHED